MTTLTEYDLSKSLSDGSVVDWKSASLWSTGTIPNDPSALVVFEAMTDTGGAAKSYTVEIKCGESFGICTLDMLGSKLALAGSLTLQTGVNIISDSAQIDMAGGSLTAGNLHLAGTPSVVGIIGTGAISASDYLYVQSSIVSSAQQSGGCWSYCNPCGTGGSTLSVSGGQLVNAGLLEADSGSKLVIDFSDFTNFHAGTLSGGAYEARGGTLELHTAGVITSDDASLILDGFNCGSIDSFNPATGRYVALQSSLTTITAHGSLELDSAPYLTSLALTDNGAISIQGAGAMLIAPSLTVGTGGTVLLEGETPLINDVITVKSLVDNGTITVAAGSKGPDIIAANSITGSGAIIVDPGAAVELTGAVATTLQFAGANGTVIIDTPKSMTGSFADFTTGDHITLASGAGLLGALLGLFGASGHNSGVTDSYSGTAGAGILTIHDGSTTLKLAFEGDYTQSNFSVTADSHGIEIVGVGTFNS